MRPHKIYGTPSKGKVLAEIYPVDLEGERYRGTHDSTIYAFLPFEIFYLYKGFLLANIKELQKYMESFAPYIFKDAFMKVRKKGSVYKYWYNAHICDTFNKEDYNKRQRFQQVSLRKE